MSNDFPVGFVVGIIVALLVGLVTNLLPIQMELLVSTMGALLGAASAVLGSFMVVKWQIDATKKAESRRRGEIIDRETLREFYLYEDFLDLVRGHRTYVEHLAQGIDIDKHDKVIENCTRIEGIIEIIANYRDSLDRVQTVFSYDANERFIDINRMIRNVDWACRYVLIIGRNQEAHRMSFREMVQPPAEKLIGYLEELEKCIEEKMNKCRSYLESKGLFQPIRIDTEFSSLVPFHSRHPQQSHPRPQMTADPISTDALTETLSKLDEDDRVALMQLFEMAARDPEAARRVLEALLKPAAPRAG